MSELRPCPFCGSKNTSERISPGGYEWCEDCKNPFIYGMDGFISVRIKDFERAYVSRITFENLKSHAEAAEARIAELERTIGEATAPYISRKPAPDEWPSLVRMCAEGWEAMDRVAELEAALKHEENEKLTIFDANKSEITWLREKVKELEEEIKRLHAALDITNRILDGTGHSIQIDERGRYYIHSNNCDHYPLPDVVKDGEK